MLRRHDDGFAAWGKSGFNAVALIGRADDVRAKDRDPFAGAADQAREARPALGAAVADVVAVSPLLAATARTHALSDADLVTLTALAANPPSDLLLDNAAVLGALRGMARPVALLDRYGTRMQVVAELRPELVLMDVCKPGHRRRRGGGSDPRRDPTSVVVLCSSHAREDLSITLQGAGCGGPSAQGGAARARPAGAHGPRSTRKARPLVPALSCHSDQPTRTYRGKRAIADAIGPFPAIRR